MQLFALFRAASAAEKVATLIDFIEFCTACHVEGRGFEPRRPRHCFQCVGARQLKSVTSRAPRRLDHGHDLLPPHPSPPDYRADRRRTGKVSFANGPCRRRSIGGSNGLPGQGIWAGTWSASSQSNATRGLGITINPSASKGDYAGSGVLAVRHRPPSDARPSIAMLS